MVSSSQSHQDQQQTPPPQLDGSKMVTIATAAAAASRRLPPPCWSHDETVALIDAYREKWYSLRRGNLRASHWQDVADDVANRSPVNTPKTAVQCRHKMEKLRKRYRAEIQRAVPYGGSRGQRYCSAWIHFKRMDAMEKGTNVATTGGTTDDDEDDEQEELNVKKIGDVYSMNNSSEFHSRNNFHEPMTNGGSGFRIRIPGKNGIGSSGSGGGGAGAKVYSRFDEMGGQSSGNFGVNKGFGGNGKRAAVEVEQKKGDPVEEMVEAIKMLGDGFVRMEKMKMEMAREVEEMRMDMEMKRTEMILESQQKIVEALANAIAEGGGGGGKNKKMKRMPDDDEC